MLITGDLKASVHQNYWQIIDAFETKGLYGYFSLEKPPAPSQVQLIKATTNSFHVKWDEVPTVEGYLLQLNTDLTYQATSSDSSAAPSVLGKISVMLEECMSARVLLKNPESHVVVMLGSGRCGDLTCPGTYLVTCPGTYLVTW